MISRLCRSSYSGFKFVNVSPILKFPYETGFNRNCIYLHKNHIHSYNDNIDKTEVFSGIVEDLTIPDIPMMDENVILNVLTDPSFASLGLNNFTPPGLIQSILENVHIYFNLPWWACIGITAILLRSCMLPVMFNQRRVLAHYQKQMTTITNVMLEACQARNSGDSLLMMAKMREFEQVVGADKISIFPLLKPVMIQAPLFISVFMALRGMAEAPVASLKTGGLSWFTDLTIYDPYYILPIITAVTLACVIESGAEAPGPQGKTMKLVFRCIPAITFVIICHFPSTLLLYWTCSNLFSLGFVSLMNIPKFRTTFNLPDMTPSPPADNPNNYGLKDIMSMMQSMQEVAVRTKAEQMRWGKEDQDAILDRGIAAAAERKRLKEEMKLKAITESSETSDIKDKV